MSSSPAAQPPVAAPGPEPAALLAGPPAQVSLGRRSLAMLFLLALVVRLAHVLAMTASPYFTNPVIDAAEYDRLGWAIAHGSGHPEPVFWHPPGYPYFLGLIWSVVGDSYLAPRLVQAVLGAWSVAVTAWIGCRAFGRQVGLAAGIAGAFYAVLVYFDAELLAPTLTIACALGAVALGMLARPRPGSNRARVLWIGAGAVGGLASLAVATSLVVPVLLAVWARRRAPWVLLGLAMVLAPVTVHNYRGSGQFVPISRNGGVNFWLGNNPNYQRLLDIRPDAEWQRLVNEPVLAGMRGPAAQSDYFVRKALDWARHHPGDCLRLQLHKLRLLLSGHEIYRNQAIYPARAVSPVLRVLLWKLPGLAFPFGLLMPLAAVGLWVGGRRAPLLTALVAGLALTVLTFFVTARYRVVMVPFLLIFAALGGRWLLFEAKRRARLVGGAAAVGLYLLANLGQGPMDTRMNADAEYSLGMRLGERGHLREASAFFESAVASRPDYAAAWLNLTVCYHALGKPDQAQSAMARAFAADPAATVESVQSFASTGKPALVEPLAAYLRQVSARPPAVPEP